MVSLNKAIYWAVIWPNHSLKEKKITAFLAHCLTIIALIRIFLSAFQLLNLVHRHRELVFHRHCRIFEAICTKIEWLTFCRVR